MHDIVSIKLGENGSKLFRSGGLPRFLAKFQWQVTEWRKRMRGRYLLSQLDDRMLSDVGLNRSDVDRECAKYFWQC
jgi:uncharacterized protein YjiS (DUF1127 family)